MDVMGKDEKYEEFFPPKIRYTKSNNINIAYQVFGSGEIDLIYIPRWVSNIDWMWNCPDLVSFFEELSKVVRIIIFDKRGTGLSDREIGHSTLEERMEDIKAVMDAVDSKKAVLFGHSEGGSMSVLFSTIYPNRVICLITFGLFAKRRCSSDYPWAPTDKERQELYDKIKTSWGSEGMKLKMLAPSRADDDKFMRWLASYFRYGASPSSALRLTKMNTEIDIIHVLKYVKVPTLIMQRTNDVDVKIEEGKFIAERIKGAKFVEFNDGNHFFWIGNKTEVLEEMKNFITRLPLSKSRKKGLVTVLFGQILTSLKSILKLEMFNQIITQCGGVIINKESNQYIIIFQSPSKAVQCGLFLKEVLKKKNVLSAMGVYLKEDYFSDDVKISPLDKYMINRITLQLNSYQILATHKVRELLFSGVGLNFTYSKSILSFASQELCKLYCVTKKQKGFEQFPLFNSSFFDNSFLEDVLNIIDKYLHRESFNVAVLSEKMKLSKRQLQRKVREVTSKSPSQLIASRRLSKAKEVLVSYELTVAEIAFQHGFSSPSYFSKCFKKEFGSNPTSIAIKIKSRK